MDIKTTRFGEITIDKNRVIHFPEGVLGFPEQKDYTLLEHKPGSPFFWLQSTTIPELAFVMTDPFLIKQDFIENLTPDEKAFFNDKNDEELIIYVLVSIPNGEAEKMTVNLMGPLVINTISKVGKQVILTNSNYNHRHPMKLN